MGYACQIKRRCIQHKTCQQHPASNRQRPFQSSQWLVDFPQQSHHDFPSVQRQDRKQINDQPGRNYAKILKDAAAGKRKIAFPTREVFIKGPGMIFKGNPKKYLTEIQLPIGG